MIVASTAADVRDVVVEGESGLKTLYPSIQYEPSKRRLTWANGTTATLFSADEPNSLRGPQGHWAICDELAKWRYPETFDQLMLGLRLGQNPRVAVATTPRPTEIIKRLLKDPHCAVTRGSTYDNKDNLAPAFMQQIISRYEGTRLGRQELNAEVLEDSMGALWKRSQIDALRVETMPTLRSVVVAVDPSGSKGGDECGIVVAGMGENEHGYILEDLSLQALPDQWARAAVAAYHKHKANQIIAEGNYGGEMVRLTIQTVPGAPQVKIISASHSKQARAEPVASLYEQGKIHHVGFYPQLEDELTNWEPNTGAASPNRLDALVWAMTELMLQGSIQLWL